MSNPAETAVFRPSSVLDDYFMTVLIYETQHQLMFSLARFQEFAENTVLKGTVFTREDLLKIQPAYYSSWNGCNFDWATVDAVSKWTDLDASEQVVVETLAGRSPKYVVGVHAANGPAAVTNVLKHERAHAIWAARPDYREGIADMLDFHYTQVSRDHMRAILTDRGYHPSVHVDEIQAYHQNGWDKVFGEIPRCPEFCLAQSSFITQIYREVRAPVPAGV